uniref:Centrosomin N-terminal motif 1 domain-containing protein n=1 Tax=Spongospora subterranea TaxID=70186 RepID=A0A0H5QTN9_9EUKA|eukprot:CRZ05097.1 hypothetical protein [Spongospora subterranea]
MKGHVPKPVQGSGKASDYMNSLEQENFNLKLRVYHLEERLSQQYPTDAYQLTISNAEANAQLDAKSEAIQQRDFLLLKARNVIETLQNDIELIKASNSVRQNTEDSLNHEELARARSSIATLTQSGLESERRLQMVAAELELKSGELETTRAESVALKVEYARSKAESEQARMDWREGQDRLSICEESESLLKRQLNDQIIRCDELKDRHRSAVIDLESSRRDHANLSAVNSGLAKELLEKEHECRSLKHCQSTLIDLQEKASTWERQKADLEATSSELRGRAEALDRAKADCERRLELAQQLQEASQAQVRPSLRFQGLLEDVVQGLDSLNLPSIPIGSGRSSGVVVDRFDDESRPPPLSVLDSTQIDAIGQWIQRKLIRLRKIRSSFQLTLQQAQVLWEKQFERLEKTVEGQERRFTGLVGPMNGSCVFN